jgi:SAM-dependent methyltransferase
MTVSSPYDAQFFEFHRSMSLNSARAVLPHLISLVHPRSAVDLGCGTGEWLAAFRECGITDVLGVDGDWVPREQLQIPENQFMHHDLRHPLHLERTFDCAVSMETAEHLPPDCAATFVSSLVSLAPVVLFSAALPGQGGRDHLNEQWPSYWSDLFRRHGYVAIDCIRPVICTLPDVQYWYVWNVFLFAERFYVERHANLKAQYEEHGGPALPWVDANFWSGGKDSWSGELRRMRNFWKSHDDAELQGAAVLLAAARNLERLVSELRDERDAWKAQAKRHEEATQELRGLLHEQIKKKRSKEGKGKRSR